MKIKSRMVFLTGSRRRDILMIMSAGYVKGVNEVVCMITMGVSEFRNKEFEKAWSLDLRILKRRRTSRR